MHTLRAGLGQTALDNNYLERLRQKRADAEAEKKRASLLRAQRASATKNSNEIAGTIAIEGAKTRTSTQKVDVTNSDLAKSDDMAKVVEKINQMNLTTFMSTRGFFDMSENIQTLAKDVETLQQKLEDEGLTSISSAFQGLVTKLEAITRSLNQTKIKTDDSIVKAFNELKTAIGKLEVNPVVKVSAPEPRVITTPVDMSGVSRAIESLKVEEEEEFSLEGYIAQDLDDKNPGFQYVGLVKPDGRWCFIQNDIDGNSLRYAFGDKNYASNWKDRVNKVYKRIDKAVI